MGKLFVLLLLFASCSNSNVQENSNLPLSQNRNTSNIIQDNDNSNSIKPIFSSQNWEVTTNNAIARRAMILAIAKTPDGDVQTVLSLDCPTKENMVFDFEYIVIDTDKIPSFNFRDFEGPEAPAQKEKLVEIQTNSPNGKQSWFYAASGGFGDASDFGATTTFWFEPSTLNKPDKTTEIAQIIAEGSSEVTITVHDYKDKQKTIKTTFPAIDVSSNVAKILNGCRK